MLDKSLKQYAMNGILTFATDTGDVNINENQIVYGTHDGSALYLYCDLNGSHVPEQSKRLTRLVKTIDTPTIVADTRNMIAATSAARYKNTTTVYLNVDRIIKVLDGEESTKAAVMITGVGKTPRKIETGVVVATLITAINDKVTDAYQEELP